MFDFLYTNKWESNEWFANQEYETIGSGLLFVEFIESDLIDWTVIDSYRLFWHLWHHISYHIWYHFEIIFKFENGVNFSQI